MLVYIEDIQQNLSLSTQQVESFALLKLPTGETIRVPLDDEQLMKIMSASAAAPSHGPQEVAGQVVRNTVDQHYQPPEPVEEEPTELVRWAELPPTVLPEEIKEVLAASGIDEEIPMVELIAMADEISERMIQRAEASGQPQPQTEQLTPEQYAQWPQKPQVPQQPVQPRPRPRQQPRQQPVGRVIVPQSPPVRSVPKDDMGYPVVQGMANTDPGEVAAIVGDEDGVNSL